MSFQLLQELPSTPVPAAWWLVNVTVASSPPLAALVREVRVIPESEVDP